MPGKKSKKDPDWAADFVLKDDDLLAAFDGENCLGWHFDSERAG